MKILVCGGRDFNDQDVVFEALARLPSVSCLVHGGASGADTLGAVWAVSRGIETKRYPANWKTHGTAAGPIRNQRMLDHNPDIELVVAFPGGRGTANMVSLARAAGVKVLEVKA